MLKNTEFDTAPLIIHAQGPHLNKPHWEPIRNWLFSQPERQLQCPEELTILTWNNGHHNMGLFEKSMARLGLPCTVLGQGVTHWVNTHKLHLTYEALLKINTKYILGVDSRDAVLLDDPSRLLNTYLRAFDADLVFSADLMNWPSMAVFKHFEHRCAQGSGSEYKYLNAGAFIGKTAFCREFFLAATNIPPEPLAPESDQAACKHAFQQFYPQVQLDYRCQLFQNIGFLFKNSLSYL